MISSVPQTDPHDPILADLTFLLLLITTNTGFNHMPLRPCCYFMIHLKKYGPRSTPTRNSDSGSHELSLSPYTNVLRNECITPTSPPRTVNLSRFVPPLDFILIRSPPPAA